VAAVPVAVGRLRSAIADGPPRRLPLVVR